jgi:cold shock protein
MVTGTVRFWHDELGWGVLDSPETPGGCWAHFSQLIMPGYGALTAGEPVSFTYEAGDQDGYAFRAVEVRPAWVDPSYVREPPTQSTGYRSGLTIPSEDSDESPGDP